MLTRVTRIRMCKPDNFYFESSRAKSHSVCATSPSIFGHSYKKCFSCECNGICKSGTEVGLARRKGGGGVGLRVTRLLLICLYHDMRSTRVRRCTDGDGLSHLAVTTPTCTCTMLESHQTGGDGRQGYCETFGIFRQKCEGMSVTALLSQSHTGHYDVVMQP
jgi:hypothetical protein